jgi:hypothetical protein
MLAGQMRGPVQTPARAEEANHHPRVTNAPVTQ